MAQSAAVVSAPPLLDVERYPSRASLAGRLLRAPLALIPRRAVVPILQGPLRGSKWIVGSGIYRLWLGSYEPDKMALAARLVEAGDIVFDVGANVGIYTLLLAQRAGPAGHVVAFEPDPANAAFVRRHVGLNALVNVSTIEAAVTDHTGTARFHRTGISSTGRVAPTGLVEVRTTTLDDFVAASGRRPSLVKIDVEGGEMDVLVGAETTLRLARPRILLATHSTALATLCGDYLRRQGYHVLPLTGARGTIDNECLAVPQEQSGR